MPTRPRRRWFQFSLRTLFVAVTVIAVWLGWQLKIVRERQAVLQWIEYNDGAYWTPASMSVEVRGFTPTSKAVPVWRAWLGDETIEGVHMPLECTDSDFARVQSIITEIPRDYPLKRRGGAWFSDWPVDEESYQRMIR